MGGIDFLIQKSVLIWQYLVCLQAGTRHGRPWNASEVPGRLPGARNDVAGARRTWPGLAWACKSYQGLAGPGRGWPGLAGVGRGYQGLVRLAGVGRSWQGLAGAGRSWWFPH